MTRPSVYTNPSPAPPTGTTPGATFLAGGWFARFVRRAAIVGLATSLVLHTLFMTAAYVLRIAGGGGTPGGGAAGNSSVEVAVMSQEELASSAEAEIDASGPQAAELPDTVMPEVMLGTIDGGAGGEDSGDLGQMGPGIGGSGSGTGVGVGDGSGGSGGGGTTFFGVSARGSRFAYIVDISGSMSERGKLPQLKRELVSSLDKLPASAQFLVLLFQSETNAVGGRERWVEASAKNKQWAEREIRGVLASGGTNPGPAFVSTLSMKPRPDAIYFMTDGVFDADIAPRVARMNKVAGRTIPIHCIAFSERGSEAVMRKIAEESGGTYTFVEAPSR